MQQSGGLLLAADLDGGNTLHSASGRMAANPLTPTLLDRSFGYEPFLNGRPLYLQVYEAMIRLVNKLEFDRLRGMLHMRIAQMNITGVIDFAERINHHMDERKKLNLNLVYNQIKDKYPVVLTNAYALDNGRKDFDEDYQIMYGMSTAGKFLLYDDGLDIIFDADKVDGTYTHWHPVDTEEAIKDVILFMNGTSKY